MSIRYSGVVADGMMQLTSLDEGRGVSTLQARRVDESVDAGSGPARAHRRRKRPCRTPLTAARPRRARHALPPPASALPLAQAATGWSLRAAGETAAARVARSAAERPRHDAAHGLVEPAKTRFADRRRGDPPGGRRPRRVGPQSHRLCLCRDRRRLAGRARRPRRAPPQRALPRHEGARRLHPFARAEVRLDGVRSRRRAATASRAATATRRRTPAPSRNGASTMSCSIGAARRRSIPRKTKCGPRFS